MEVFPNTTYTDLAGVLRLSRGDMAKTQKYLNQFISLVSERLARLDKGVRDVDRETIRRTLHSMRPQIVFFGMNDIVEDMKYLEMHSAGADWSEMLEKLTVIGETLRCAVREIEDIRDVMDQGDQG